MRRLWGETKQEKKGVRLRPLLGEKVFSMTESMENDQSGGLRPYRRGVEREFISSDGVQWISLSY